MSNEEAVVTSKASSDMQRPKKVPNKLELGNNAATQGVQLMTPDLKSMDKD